ncbi:MAG: NUDIX domain-containing protein [Actinobacteria bacterium]|nr:NUDIX domain-containing protein [Actinomycetota bacterium]MCA1720965.1 NUDIX domain-containing protein [Actinomycetota bacterium]
MKERRIKVKAFAVLFNGTRDAHLVWRGSDDTRTPPDFHRLLGGHVEFGEPTVDAIRREVREETGCAFLDPRLLGVLENRFVYQQRPGHEVVFVYAGRLDPPEPVPATGGWLSDNDVPIWVDWRPLEPHLDQLPLYPAGVDVMITRAAGNSSE